MNHYISNIDLNAELPEGYKSIILGAGCFWGVERKFWELSDVWLTSVGYAGGLSPNPTYEQVCYEETGHVEVVKVSYDSLKISLPISILLISLVPAPISYNLESLKRRPTG